MTIGSGNLIDDADYNGIQTEVASTLGTGTGDRGYGQPLASAQVAAGTLITATQMVNLKTDIDKISFHQTNAASSAPSISAGGTILASDWTTFSTQITNLSTAANRLKIFGVDDTVGNTSQSTWLLDQATSSISNWNGNKIHTITVDFGTADGARYFFNTGGEIRLVPRHSGQTSTTTKGGRWKAMFDSLGTFGVRIGANSTKCAAGTPQTARGYYQLTTTNQQVFEIIDTGTYSGNDYTVFARVSTPLRYLYIEAYFRDDTAVTANTGTTDDGPTDEAVDGTTVSSVGSFRATGSYVAWTGTNYGLAAGQLGPAITDVDM